MAYSQDWLEDPAAIRGVLVEVKVLDVEAQEEVTFNLSTIGYLTTDSQTSFNPIITGGLQITESITVDNTTSLAFGDLEINNINGDYDNWLDNTKYIWVNRSIKIYIGDPSWVCQDIAQVRTDFLKVFDGTVTDIDSKDRDRLNIKIGDKLQRLNTPLTENKLGNLGTWIAGQTNQDTIRPVVLGEIFNMAPLLIDPAQLEYMFNDGPTELLIEIRDNGVAIHNSNITGATVNLSTGRFKLLHPLVGMCTVSVQGVPKSIDLVTGILDTTYVNNAANLVAIICTQFGNTATKLSIDEIDLINFNEFNTRNPQPVGTAILDRANILNVCHSIVSSFGAQLYMTRLGKLQILQLGIPTSDAVVDITDRDILHHSLSITNRTPVVAATKLGYCKNWAVQDNLATNIPIEHKDMMGLEWFTNSIVDPEVKLEYSLNSDPVQKDTMLINRIDADLEATRLTNYFCIPRTVYTFKGTARLLSLKLGQGVTLTHNRFNLAGGKAGQVITLSPDWATSTVQVEVIV